MKRLAALFCAAITISAIPAAAEEFSGFPVIATGQAVLSVSPDSLTVSNCVSGIPGTDGCRIAIVEPNYSYWECEMANLDIADSAPLGSSMQLIFTGDIDGSPGQLLGTVEHRKTGDSEYSFAIDLGAPTYTVSIYNDSVRVFYGEEIPASDLGLEPGTKADDIPKIRWPKYWGHDGAIRWYKDHRSRPKFGYSDTAPGPWIGPTISWPGQALPDTQFTYLEITPEYEISTTTTRLDTVSIYSTGFEVFNVLDISLGFASGVPPVASRANLKPNVPNPFNPQTTIAFELAQQDAVHLRVFDVAGRLVRVLLDGEIFSSGHHQTVWNGRDDAGMLVASGAYFYRLEAGKVSETKLMTLIK